MTKVFQPYFLGLIEDAIARAESEKKFERNSVGLPPTSVKLGQLKKALQEHIHKNVRDVWAAYEEQTRSIVFSFQLGSGTERVEVYRLLDGKIYITGEWVPEVRNAILEDEHPEPGQS